VQSSDEINSEGLRWKSAGNSLTEMFALKMPAKLRFLVLAIFATTVFAAEPPYKESELGDQLNFTPVQLRAALSDLGRFTRAKRQPAGTLFECYSDGSATIDHWLGHPARITTDIPQTGARYMRFVYRDGYPVASYVHEAGKARLSQSYYYDQRFYPAASVMNGKDGKVLLSCLLVYDNNDRIKRVMVFDAKDTLMRVVCFRHGATPEERETWLYGMGGKLEFHFLYTPEGIYRIEKGEKIFVNGIARHGFASERSKYGIRPAYPVP
jgi:hypothetical protein